MRDLGEATGFTMGAVGEPGKRTFYIEVEGQLGTSWFLAEKGQVASLALQGRELLKRINRPAADDITAPDLGIFHEPEFRVGSISMAYSPASELIQIELTSVDDDAEAVVFFVTTDQMAAATATGASAVAAGRPHCPRCSLAMDPEGHVCPTTNGDLRNHRP